MRNRYRSSGSELPKANVTTVSMALSTSRSDVRSTCSASIETVCVAFSMPHVCGHFARATSPLAR